MTSEESKSQMNRNEIVSRDDGPPDCPGCGDQLTEIGEDMYRCEPCDREFRWNSIYSDGGL